jgi:hydrogenase maturation protein HypF
MGPVRRLRITVRGIVQGVGFRPFVYNAASAESLSGWVLNEPDAVRIEVQGEPSALERFLDTLRHRHPPQARIEGLDVCEILADAADSELAGFQIRTSTGDTRPRPTIPADLATCAECLQEIRDPRQRRYRYPFTNCTNCGPRWSIIEQLPYDRPRTSMHRFQMCEACRTEYEDPADRRFHAQPIACPACGPELQLLACDRRVLASRDEALCQAAEAVLAGQILALKGLGGFQLVADATNEPSVQRLRLRKRRPDKPFAVMMASLAEVRQRCEVSSEEAAVLQSPSAPILLLRQRTDPEADDVAPSVAPGNPYLGVMLPYTPLHHLLLGQVGRPIICTSGNLSEEPMAITTEDALERLGAIADLLLTHNRPIVRPVDDSVGRVGPEGLQITRRARGYAPLPIRLHRSQPADREKPSTILAVGGHLKNTVALSLGSSVVMTPHIGDLDSVLSVEVHRQAIEDLVSFFGVTPETIVCDLHPDYASTQVAEHLAARWNVPLLRVQHHHAHVAACVAERGIEGPVLGLSWDGTGFGPDRTVWGGEVLLCDGDAFRRVAHLRTFSLPGGDRAAREPRRSALGLLFEIMGDAAAEIARAWFTPAEMTTLLAALKRPGLFPRTSSMGRLFDGVAALCGLPDRVTFEGQAAMALEFAADSDVGDAYPLPLSDYEPAIADWEPLVRSVLADRASGIPVGQIAAKFHNALADLAVAAAQRFASAHLLPPAPDSSPKRQRGGTPPADSDHLLPLATDRNPKRQRAAEPPAACRRVVLTGGCFQNALLTGRVRARLLATGLEVYTHQEVPPGDGGIALGQVSIALSKSTASLGSAAGR